LERKAVNWAYKWVPLSKALNLLRSKLNKKYIW
jgi:hypothetical protein